MKKKKNQKGTPRKNRKKKDKKKKQSSTPQPSKYTGNTEQLIAELNKDNTFTKELLKNMPPGAVILPMISGELKEIAFFIKDSKDFLKKVSNPFFETRTSIGEIFVGEKKVIVGVLYVEIFAVDGQSTTYEMFLNVFHETNDFIYKQLAMQDRLYFLLYSEDGERVGNGFSAKSPAFIKESIDKLFSLAGTVEKWTFDEFNVAKGMYLQEVSMEKLAEKNKLMRRMN